MKKKFLSVMLFAAIAFGSAGTFTSCKDYDDDIDSLQEQVTTNKDAAEKAIKGLTDQYTALKGDLETKEKALKDAIGQVDKDLDAAKADIEKAQSTGDQALAEAGAAKEAAATAKREAIEEAQRLVDEAKTALEGKITEEKNALLEMIGKKVDKTVFDEKVTEFTNSITALQDNVKEINSTVTALGKTVEELIQTVKDNYDALKQLIDANGEKIQANADSIDQVATNLAEHIVAINKKLVEQEKALKEYADDQAAQAKAQAIAEAQRMVAELKVFVDENTRLIGVNADSIASNANKIALNKEAIEVLQDSVASHADRILVLEKEMDEAQADILDLQGRMGEAEEAIDALEERMDKAEAAINQLRKELNTLKGRVDNLVQAVTDRLTSITLVPDAYVAGIPSLVFNTLGYQAIPDDAEHECMTLWDYYLETNFSNYFEKEDQVEFRKAFAHDYDHTITPDCQVKYRLNPHTVSLDAADFRLVGAKVKEFYGADYEYWENHRFLTKSAEYLPVSISGDGSIDNGVVTFNVKKNLNFEYGQNEEANMTVFALEAKLKMGLTEKEQGTDVRLYSENMRAADNMIHQRFLGVARKNMLDASGKYFKKDVEILFPSTFVIAREYMDPIEMIYNKDFNAKELVATAYARELYPGLDPKDEHRRYENFDIEKYNLKYRFSVAKTPYEVDDEDLGITNQQTVLQCIDENEGIFRVQDGPEGQKYNRESIGRTPIIKVELVDPEGRIVRQAFIKLFVTVERIQEALIPLESFEFIMGCENECYTAKLDVDYFRNVLKTYNMAHTDLLTEYEFSKVSGPGEAKFLEHQDENPNTSIVEWTVCNDALEFKDNILRDQQVNAVFEFTNQNPASANPAVIRIPVTMLVIVPRDEKGRLTYWSADTVQEQWTDNRVYTMNFSKPKLPSDYDGNFFFANKFTNAFVEGSINEGSVTRFGECNTKTWRIHNEASYPGLVLINPENTEIILDEEAGGVEKTLALLNEDKLDIVLERVYTFTIGGREFEEVAYSFQAHIVRPVNVQAPAGLSFVGDKHDVIPGSRQQVYFAGMLTDWMGNKIIPPHVKIQKVPVYGWVHQCEGTKYPIYTPDWYEMITPADIEVTTEEITVPARTSVIRYNTGVKFEGTIHTTYVYNEPDMEPIYMHKSKDIQNSMSFAKDLQTPDETSAANIAQKAVTNYLNAMASKNSIVDNGREFEYVGHTVDFTYDLLHEDRSVKEGEDLTYPIVTNVKFIPATYERHEGELIYVHECNDEPDWEDFAEPKPGDRSGCWVYKQLDNEYDIDGNLDKGQYWFFYGIEFTGVNVESDLEWYFPESFDWTFADFTAIPYMVMTSEATYADGSKLPDYYHFSVDGYDLVFRNDEGSTVSKVFQAKMPVEICYKFGYVRTYMYVTVYPAGQEPADK